MDEPLRWPRDIRQAIVAAVADCYPEEGCGLVVGRAGDAVAVWPVTNALHSPIRFRMDAQEQVAALLRLPAEGLELLAIYHSHPSGPPVPSSTDLAEFAYPGVLALIASPGTGDWKPGTGDWKPGTGDWKPGTGDWFIRAFDLSSGQSQEIRIEWTD